MKRPSAIFPQRIRFTCWIDRLGREGAHGRLQIGHQQRRRNAFPDNVGDGEREPRVTEADRVEAVAADTRRGLPGDGHFPAVNLRNLLRQQPLLNAERLGQLAALRGILAPPRASRGDFASQRREQLAVVPRLLHEVADAPPHRFDGEIDAAPAGHDDDGQEPIVILHARQEVDPFAPRRRVAGVIEIHQDEIERARAQRRDRRLGRGDRVVFDPRAFEQETQRVQQVGLIVGDQDPRRRVAGDWHDRTAKFQSSCHQRL